MFQFETQIHKLRHDVLTAIARLGKEDNLTREAMDNIQYEIIKVRNLHTDAVFIKKEL